MGFLPYTIDGTHCDPDQYSASDHRYVLDTILVCNSCRYITALYPPNVDARWADSTAKLNPELCSLWFPEHFSIGIGFSLQANEMPKLTEQLAAPLRQMQVRTHTHLYLYREKYCIVGKLYHHPSSNE